MDPEFKLDMATSDSTRATTKTPAEAILCTISLPSTWLYRQADSFNEPPEGPLTIDEWQVEGQQPRPAGNDEQLRFHTVNKELSAKSPTNEYEDRCVGIRLLQTSPVSVDYFDEPGVFNRS